MRSSECRRPPIGCMPGPPMLQRCGQAAPPEPQPQLKAPGFTSNVHFENTAIAQIEQLYACVATSRDAHGRLRSGPSHSSLILDRLAVLFDQNKVQLLGEADHFGVAQLQLAQAMVRKRALDIDYV